MRGLPTTLFLPVFVNRGHSSVSGSKTTTVGGGGRFVGGGEHGPANEVGIAGSEH